MDWLGFLASPWGGLPTDDEEIREYGGYVGTLSAPHVGRGNR